MKINFEELLNIASKKSDLNGKELSKRLIKMFCITGVKKEKQIEGIAQTIFTLLDFNAYYDNTTGDFWDLKDIKNHIRKCI